MRPLLGIPASNRQTNNKIQLVHVESDSIAEQAFLRFGYTEIGRVPQYSRFPPNGKKPATFFYKDLGSSLSSQ